MTAFVATYSICITYVILALGVTHEPREELLLSQTSKLGLSPLLRRLDISTDLLPFHEAMTIMATKFAKYVDINE